MLDLLLHNPEKWSLHTAVMNNNCINLTVIEVVDQNSINSVY